jgi:GNAT superfamily N-acetyltransferase
VSPSTFVSVEVDADTAVAARLALGAGSGGMAVRLAQRAWTLVDLAAEPPGWVALAGVRDADGAEPVLVELLVEPRHLGQGLERDLLDAVTQRLRAAGARRLHIGAEISLEL